MKDAQEGNIPFYFKVMFTRHLNQEKYKIVHGKNEVKMDQKYGNKGHPEGESTPPPLFS